MTIEERIEELKKKNLKIRDEIVKLNQVLYDNEDELEELEHAQGR